MSIANRKPVSFKSIGCLFEDWIARLDYCSSLSQRNKYRYASLLARYSRSADRASIQAAQDVAHYHPREALEILLGVTPTVIESGRGVTRQFLAYDFVSQYCGSDNDDDLSRKDEIVFSPRDVDPEALLNNLRLSDTPCSMYMSRMPPMEQTQVPIAPDRNAKLLSTRSGAFDFVGIQWKRRSVPTRLAAKQLLQSEVLPIMNSGNVSHTFLIEDEDLIIIERNAENAWVISKNYGVTLEDQLRSEDLDLKERAQVVKSLAFFYRSMVSAKVFWGGFAPRNMFLKNSRILLIDFEKAVRVSDCPATAATLDAWFRIWWADSLTGEEAKVVFGDQCPQLAVDDDRILEADRFERELTGATTLSWRDRKKIMSASVRIEGRHKRAGQFENKVLYGHQLGHFWGDFLPVREEIKIFQFLRAIEESAVLAECLEIFEAAMEADIHMMLVLAARGDCRSCYESTAKLAALLSSLQAHQMSTVRRAFTDWYDRLIHEPSRLISDVLYSLGVSSLPKPGDCGEEFIGKLDQRDQHFKALSQAVGLGLTFLNRPENSEPFLRFKSNDELRDCLCESLPHQGRGLQDCLEYFRDNILEHSISQSHTAYMAFPDAGNNLASMVGAVLSPFLNQNLIAIDRSAPTATFVEAQVIEWLRELVGYAVMPLAEMSGVRDMAGLWTTGGHMSNHIAMLTALGHKYPTARSEGLTSLEVQPVVLMCGPIAHYSHRDAAFHLGIGWENVRTVGASRSFTTDPDMIDKALSEREEGKEIFMVVGVAGNCRTTGIDDINRLADICEKHSVWFHVDACHGGNLIFSSKLRDAHLRGLSRADSVAIDPHKGLFSPYPSSYVLFKDRGLLRQYSRHETAVNAEGVWDLGLIMPFFGSRGFESLRTWFMLRDLGVERIGRLVEARHELMRYLEKRIKDSPFFVPFNSVDFYRLAFVFCPHSFLPYLRALNPEEHQRASSVISTFTSRLNTHLYRAGLVCFDEHTLRDLGNRIHLGTEYSYNIMGAAIGNPLLSKVDIDKNIAILEREAGTLIEEFRSALLTSVCQVRTAMPFGPAGWN